MRLTLILLGFFSVVAYAVFGAIIANNWAVTAASGVSLDETIAAMAKAHQPYSPVPGYVFLGLGVALAVGWALLALRRRSTPTWLVIALWALILTAGAAAYFLASFSNMMSVGDTFPLWNHAAALRFEAVLYLVSSVAGIVLFTVVTIALIRWILERRIAAM